MFRESYPSKNKVFSPKWICPTFRVSSRVGRPWYLMSDEYCRRCISFPTRELLISCPFFFRWIISYPFTFILRGVWLQCTGPWTFKIRLTNRSRAIFWIILAAYYNWWAICVKPFIYLSIIFYFMPMQGVLW